MNVHPAEFDGLKQEYSVKGYPTFCYFEWVESRRLSPPSLASTARYIWVGPLKSHFQSSWDQKTLW